MDNNNLTIKEYEYFLYNLKFDYEKMFNIENETEKDKILFWKSYLPGKKIIAEEFLKENALNSAIDYKVQLMMAKDTRLTDDEMYDFNNEKELVLKSKRYKKVLKNSNIKKEDFENIEFNLFIIKKYMEYEKAKFFVDLEELKKYYKNNKDKFDKVDLKQVYIKSDATKESNILNKVNEIYNLANMGIKFDDLTKDSDEFIKEENNGFFTLYRNDNNSLKNLIDWSFNEKPGTIGKIKTELGYHVCQIEKIYDNFDSLKYDVKEEYFNNLYIKKVKERKRIEEYKINVNKDILANIKLKFILIFMFKINIIKRGI
jgi:hypothetical protein